MVSVPKQFAAAINTIYPAENTQIFEAWLMSQQIPKTEREYLPIQWTSYYVNNQYGQDKKSIYDLQQFINELPRDKKYWTVVQYDDSILNDVPNIDLLRFEMSKPCEFPIPLICMPHNYQQKGSKNIFASFIGCRTHPIRDKVLSISKDGYYISNTIHNINEYCKVMASSIFNLAPRGYGYSSFRAYEGLQYGTIPVFVGDVHVQPYNIDFNEYGVKIDEQDADRIVEILEAIPPIEILRKQDRIKELYQSHFSYEGCRDRIFDYLKTPS